MFSILVRFLLRFGWIAPVTWILQVGIHGPFSLLLPVYSYLAFGIVFAAALTGIVGRVGNRVERLLGALLFAATGSSDLILTALVTGSPITAQLVIANCVLFSVAALLVAQVVLGDTDHASILRDFRFGVLGAMVILAIAFGTGRASQQVSTAPYAGLLGYALFGLAAVASGRRFAREEFTQDKRASSVDADWLAGLALMLLVTGAFALVLIQLLAFDIFGAILNLLSPLAQAAAGVIGWVLAGIYRTMSTIWAWFGFRPRVHAPPAIPPPTGPPGKSPHRGRVVNAHNLPVWMANVLKSLGIALVALIGVVAAIAAGGRARRHRSMQGERRSNSWAWGKAANWYLKQGRLHISAPSLRVPRRRRLETVRDVYRTLLRLASARERPRFIGETSLEYGDHLAVRWREVEPQLEALNQLYMEERYGSRPISQERLTAAREQLRKIGAVANRIGQEL